MKKIMATGVRFKQAGKIYDFLSKGLGEKRGDLVVIESEKGEDIATVVLPFREIEVSDSQEMKSIIRMANEDDLMRKRENMLEEAQALKTCKELAKQNKLEMKLLLAEYTLDRSKLTFYYTADSRVDFRQLVRDLARVYRTRIEMRQIGVRDATKILGGFGICGRELCCATFLKKFDNISIKTAKGNNQAMNPSKISGICGRLICCLVYEKELGCKDCAKAFNDLDEEIGEIVIVDNAEGEV